MPTIVEAVWLTPAMDGLFTGPASERRRFLDRLILCFDPGIPHACRPLRARHAAATACSPTACATAARSSGLERVMAEAGAAIAAARVEAVAAPVAVIADPPRARPGSPFPWSRSASKARWKPSSPRHAAVDVEDAYAEPSAPPHASATAPPAAPSKARIAPILIVTHGPKEMPARLCSTGEQKALLIGLVLAQAELIADRRDGAAPLLLLDEITAHLDDRPARRAVRRDPPSRQPRPG